MTNDNRHSDNTIPFDFKSIIKKNNIKSCRNIQLQENEEN